MVRSVAQPRGATDMRALILGVVLACLAHTAVAGEAVQKAAS